MSPKMVAITLHCNMRAPASDANEMTLECA